MNNCFVNRELSWLQFNERVLEEASDPQNPLCERLNFSAIFASNLDEFFMVRVGSLVDRMRVDAKKDDKTNMSCKEQFEAILDKVREIYVEKDKVYLRNMAELKEQGVELINFANLSDEDAFYLESYFNNEIKPLISPQIVGKRQPFPFLQNKKIYAFVSLETKNMNEKIGIVPCSGVFDRLIPLPSDKKRFMLVEELILHFAAQIFDRYKIKGKTLVRIVRNADIDADEAMYDYDIDYRDAMSEIIKSRT
ncbi:MAG: polyphosphate kinase 1, partial [Clostridia bacterium]